MCTMLIPGVTSRTTLKKKETKNCMDFLAGDELEQVKKKLHTNLSGEARGRHEVLADLLSQTLLGLPPSQYKQLQSCATLAVLCAVGRKMEGYVQETAFDRVIPYISEEDRNNIYQFLKHLPLVKKDCIRYELVCLKSAMGTI